jgi:hypothetical protein
MSLWAYTKSGIPIEASTDSLPPGVTFDDDFFCPSCRCKMYHKSASSNGRVAHFAGKHAEYCDIGLTSDVDGTVRSYSLSENSLAEFLETLITEGVKVPSSSRRKASTGSVAPKTGGETSSTSISKSIKTVRQLFNVLASSLPDDELYPGTKVKDIYCGISTLFLYTKYINGLHLVYAEYTGYSAKSSIMYCSYPSKAGEQIKIYLHFEKEELFKSAKKMLMGHIRKPILIFASFSNSNCDIVSLTQIVPLRR